MDMLYVRFSALATGGAIGDALFFFCSGFTLFLKPVRRGVGEFANWYKKRFGRIYPTVLAVAIIKCLFFHSSSDIIDILLFGGGWFVSCIMLYYLVVYCIGCFSDVKRAIYAAIVITFIGCVVWFALLERPLGFNMYKSANTLQGIADSAEGGYLKWLIYFLYMLLGALVGLTSKRIVSRFKADFLLLCCSVVLFYALYIIPRKVYAAEWMQILSCLPLLSVCYYSYKVCGSEKVASLFAGRKANMTMRVVGGLCLESYVIQFSLFTDKMNSIFPMNLVIMVLIVLAGAYLTRCLSRLILQSFREADYDWKRIVDII